MWTCKRGTTCGRCARTWRCSSTRRGCWWRRGASTRTCRPTSTRPRYGFEVRFITRTRKDLAGHPRAGPGPARVEPTGNAGQTPPHCATSRGTDPGPGSPKGYFPLSFDKAKPWTSRRKRRYGRRKVYRNRNLPPVSDCSPRTLFLIK